MAKLASLQAQEALLAKQLENMRAGFSIEGLATGEAQVLALEASVQKLNTSLQQSAARQAAAAAAEEAAAEAAKGLGTAVDDVSRSEGEGATAARTLFGAWGQLPAGLAAISAAERDAGSAGNGLWGVWGLLNTRVQLFGGLLG